MNALNKILESLLDRWVGMDHIPCGCPACDNGVQPGHVACAQSPAEALALEAMGVLVRACDLDQGTWRWYRVERPYRSTPMITHTPAEPLPPFFARALAEARAKVVGNDRWLAAIGRAEETFAGLQALTFLETGELLVPGRQPGVVYAATSTTCQCKAARHGLPCRHRALARLIEIALGLQAQSQRAAVTNGKTAAEEIAELFE